jgi:hypothetical protein
MTSTLYVDVPILYNPHVDDFLGEPPHFRYLGRKPLRKYGFFLDGLLQGPNPVDILVDASLSAFFPALVFSKFPKFIRVLIVRFEIKIWIKRNNINRNSLRIFNGTEALSARDLFAFSYKTAGEGFELRRGVLNKFRSVIMHLSHYFVSTGQKSENLKSLESLILAGDSDLTENFYFQHHFKWYKSSFLVLPFGVNRRFFFGAEHSARDARCVATGTFHKLECEEPRRKYKDYMQTTGFDTYHPIRRQLYQRREENNNLIVCFVEPFRRYRHGLRSLKFFYHFFISQERYFSIDLVHVYGQFRFAVVGEEVSGFPALGALEAMACGAVLIAQSGFYRGLGLQAGRHYLEYNGSVEDLIRVVKLPPSVKELDEIAKRASSYVCTEFGPEACFRRWMGALAGSGRTSVA